MAEATASKHSVCLVYNNCQGTSAYLLDPSKSGPPKALPINADYIIKRWQTRLKRTAYRNDPLAKAIGCTSSKDMANFRVMDLTAGLGRDAFNMASFGCSVVMVEQSTPLVILLEEALKKIKLLDNPDLVELGNRLQLIEGDHQQLVMNHTMTQIQPNTLYFDPMYPPTNKSALVKKETQLLHGLAGYQETTLDPNELGAFEGRLIVKRHLKAPTLFKQPTFSIKGSRVRFDVYQLKPKQAG